MSPVWSPVWTPDNELKALAERTRRVGASGSHGQVTPYVEPRSFGTQQEIRPWWLDFPADGRYFDKRGVLATPALGSSLTSVLSFTCPLGWDGVIKAISQNYTGGGLVQGSGDLTWTIRRAGAVEVEYNAGSFELGDIKDPTETLVMFQENQLIEYLVSVAAGAGIPVAGTFVICRMKGWLKPRGRGR